MGVTYSLSKEPRRVKLCSLKTSLSRPQRRSSIDGRKQLGLLSDHWDLVKDGIG
jgi:hypothetical protein